MADATTTPTGPIEQAKALVNRGGADNVSHLYCLESGHPGAKDLADPIRLFAVPVKSDNSDNGAPFCPACDRHVSAANADFDEKNEPTIPVNIRTLAARLAAQAY